MYGTPMTVETAAQVPINSARTARNMCITMNGAQDASGSLVLTLRDASSYGTAGTSTALAITVPAGAGANGVVGKWCDTTHAISIAAGHAVSIQVTNSATAGSPQPILFTVEI